MGKGIIDLLITLKPSDLILLKQTSYTVFEMRIIFVSLEIRLLIF